MGGEREKAISIAEQFNRFNSAELEKRTTLFLLEGERSQEECESKLGVIAFPSLVSDKAYRWFVLTNSQHRLRHCQIISNLDDPSALKYLNPRASLASHTKDLKFAREENLPFVTLFLSIRKRTGELVIGLRILKGIDPKPIYQQIREQCRQKLPNVN